MEILLFYQTLSDIPNALSGNNCSVWLISYPTRSMLNRFVPSFSLPCGGNAPRLLPPVCVHSDSLQLLDCTLVSDIARVQSGLRLKEQYLHLLICHRQMLNSLRDDHKLPFVEAQITVP